MAEKGEIPPDIGHYYPHLHFFYTHCNNLVGPY